MLDSPVDIIRATIQIEQPVGASERTLGTGFLVSVTRPDGSPETVLITANHVLAGMPGQEARIGYRTEAVGGTWSYTPQPLRIRDPAGAPQWTRHPTHDIAAMRIEAPEAFARAAIPAGYLATDESFDQQRLSTGDELMVLGFPRGVAANNAGFPILRSGRVASYPLSPTASPTFLLDFSVFPGNSGGPVFLTGGPRRTSSTPAHPLIAGILTQQVEFNHERLEIGIVIHAKFIAETIAMMDPTLTPHQPSPPAAASVAQSETMPGAQPVASTPAPRSLWVRQAEAVQEGAARLAHAAAQSWRRFSERLFAWMDLDRSPAGGEVRQA